MEEAQRGGGEQQHACFPLLAIQAKKVDEVTEVFRELTRTDKAKIRKAVEQTCASYDKEYGCMLLDTGCCMLTKGYTGKCPCKYFEDAVLPVSPELNELFGRINTKVCKGCGRPFPSAGHKLYCCDVCAAEAKRKAERERKRKSRSKQG